MNLFVRDLCIIIQIIFSYLSHIEYNMPDLSLLCVLERANLPRNMIENSMFEEEPDVVDLAKDSSSSFPVRSRNDLPSYLSELFYLKEQRHLEYISKHTPPWLFRTSLKYRDLHNLKGLTSNTSER